LIFILVENICAMDFSSCSWYVLHQKINMTNVGMTIV